MTEPVPEPQEQLSETDAAGTDATAADATAEDTTSTADSADNSQLTVPPRPAQTEEQNKLAADVEEAMYEVVDPELGINVVDLGLVYDIWIEDDSVACIFMTLTSPACPLTDMLTDQTANEVMKVEGISDFRLTWVWSPAWAPYMITEDGREQMRALGFSV